MTQNSNVINNSFLKWLKQRFLHKFPDCSCQCMHAHVRAHTHTHTHICIIYIYIYIVTQDRREEKILAWTHKRCYEYRKHSLQFVDTNALSRRYSSYKPKSKTIFRIHNHKISYKKKRPPIVTSSYSLQFNTPQETTIYNLHRHCHENYNCKHKTII